MKKVAFITGATGGIGSAIAETLAENGYHLQLHYHKNEKQAQELQATLTSTFDIDVTLCQADLTQNTGVDQIIDQLYQTPDIMVHNAGMAHYGLFTDVGEEEYTSMMQLHLTSPFRLTQKLIPKMITKKWGRIVFVTSVWAEAGASCESLYAMVKGGTTSFMKSIAKELAPSGITVNAVAPGVTDTPMMDQFTAEEKQAIREEIPAGRFGEPAEIAHAVHFLVQEKSQYITGQTLRINGGWYT